MSDHIDFDTDMSARSDAGHFTSRTILGRPELPGMAGWLMQKGIIKSETSAHGFMLGLIIFNLVVAVLVFYFFVLR